MGPDPAVAAVRLAVRGVLREIDAGDLVLVACSGGADSLALAGALAFEAARSGHRAGGVTVDHGLQDGSAERAAEVVRTMAGLGLEPAEAVHVTVGTSGGPEAAARDARYAALADAAARHRATAVLLGHTRDDQAETVLLGLARGSGARSLAGMAKAAGPYRRPLLDLDRDLVRRACLAMGLDPWEDPHNGDPAFARSRIRRNLLPLLEKELGPGMAAALARTARMLRDDADALDAWAERALQEAGKPGEAEGAPDVREAEGAPDVGKAEGTTALREAEGGGDGPGRAALGTSAEGRETVLAVEVLAGLPRAVRTRVLRRAAIAAGSPPGTLAAVHVDAVDALVTAWRGQSHVDLPGRVQARRRYERLLFGPSESSDK
ncbi:tRNA lysidine(34) synthetase TilS [Actinoallomurus soli]|uniref:tRNA lysidine(34) synthetase TilS n=1 Tax=Actinoallomurus soli TaxID=2952535 RepID=UPI0020935AC3|nr:tRNA lysidine(34) synthetase TilS [Actinoallomurus soli]MCO5968180.1 tRNA lysidine(34) synthetase TilS [Actinoallomurus soli]